MTFSDTNIQGSQYIGSKYFLLTHTLFYQIKAWVPHPVRIGSYLSTEHHMNPFQLIGNTSYILMGPSIHPGKCF